MTLIDSPLLLYRRTCYRLLERPREPDVDTSYSSSASFPSIVTIVWFNVSVSPLESFDCRDPVVHARVVGDLGTFPAHARSLIHTVIIRIRLSNRTIPSSFFHSFQNRPFACAHSAPSPAVAWVKAFFAEDLSLRPWGIHLLRSFTATLMLSASRARQTMPSIRKP